MNKNLQGKRYDCINTNIREMSGSLASSNIIFFCLRLAHTATQQIDYFLSVQLLNNELHRFVDKLSPLHFLTFPNSCVLLLLINLNLGSKIFSFFGSYTTISCIPTLKGDFEIMLSFLCTQYNILKHLFKNVLKL